MTREEILNMPAGRDMDALIAIKVMGLPEIDLEIANCPYCDEEMWHGARARCTNCNEWRYSPYKQYSDEIESAWEVVEHFGNKYREVSIEQSNWHDQWSVSLYGSARCIATADTAPLAICRAALLAVV